LLDLSAHKGIEPAILGIVIWIAADPIGHGPGLLTVFGDQTVRPGLCTAPEFNPPFQKVEHPQPGSGWSDMPEQHGQSGANCQALTKQSREMSLVEAMTNVVAGYGLAIMTQSIVFPMFGLWMSMGQNLVIGAIFTAVSIIRSYGLRRLFEAIRVRYLSDKPPPNHRFYG
jgi:hypothetical protein